MHFWKGHFRVAQYFRKLHKANIAYHMQILCDTIEPEVKRASLVQLSKSGVKGHKMSAKILCFSWNLVAYWTHMGRKLDAWTHIGRRAAYWTQGRLLAAYGTHF